MDAIIAKLTAIAEESSSETLRNVISRLQADPEVSWDALVADFNALQAEGLLQKSEENDKLLQDLRAYLTEKTSHSQKTYGSDISIVQVPDEQTRTLPRMHISALPPELLDAINQVFYLRVLANEPERVLPPGKSLLSMVARPHAQTEHRTDGVPSLRAKVEDIAKRAFWDEALEALSNQAASSQVHRIQALYKDLHEALKFLLPPKHPVLLRLGAPLSPTSSPLLSAITHLREVVTALRERCAPARDTDINALLLRLDDANSTLPHTEVARIVVDAVRSILSFADVMKDDLGQFVLGTMSEKQLRSAIAQEAKLRERQLVVELWGDQCTQDRWTQWMAQLHGTYTSVDAVPGRRRWILRFVEAMGSIVAVSCPDIPAAPPASQDGATATDQDRNELPPPLFFSGPSLLEIQNFLQALVIAATLRSLTRLPSSPPNPLDARPSGNVSFMERVWTLLKAEIHGEPGSGDTKLINLEDEVIRARKSTGDTLEAAEEEKLRAAVSRTLQIHDPVYLLLQKRLLSAVSTRLLQTSAVPRPLVPAHLQSGRERPGKRPRLAIDDEPEERERTPDADIVVKGFEDPVLVGAISDVVRRLRSIVEWTKDVWSDLVEREPSMDRQTHTHEDGT
ncbi:hypothetical protein OE88DRAFT_1654844 [Heliocybe sulcata]|uniref:Uncharacterized protein n=1 Tax=Heliocybe sulcata TaxID=5364 RepID=A0A5C3N9B1_9AGAM|nr:hypothetical protein OE88DRAFT_1654844 [Heliocybe sulcata]